MKTKTSLNHDNPPAEKPLLAARKNVVLSAERMPTKEGYYKTNIGIQYLENVPEGLGIKAGLSWQFGMTAEWWEE